MIGLMKLDVKNGLKIIALRGFTVAVIYGAAFAQHPKPAAPSAPVADIGARISRAVSELPASSEAPERERILLERIERLERRLNELESRFDITATTEGRACMPIPPPPQPGVAAPPDVAAPKAATASQQRQAQTTKAHAPPPLAAWDKDGVKIIPYGILVANVNYNTSSLTPGSFGVFALPKLLPDQDQFHISPGNTFLGVDVKWPKIGKWEINGKVDIDLRGVAPLIADNIFQPQFLNIYGEARTERYRILAGQTIDIVAPLFPNSLNLYPLSFMPGSLGYFRPQVRFETYQPISGDYTFIFQGAVTQTIQTLQVSDEVLGRQTGLPDGQARVALGYGKPVHKGLVQKRPFELGISGHLGQRRATSLTPPFIEQGFTSWSGTIDLSFNIGSKLRFEGEYYGGSILGDYAGGIFQTFNPERLVAIRAAGAWAQLTYDISEKWQVNGAYGRDDTYNRDLAFGQRSLNEMGFGNVFYRITPRLWVALEFSRWRTRWVGLPAGNAFRVEPAVLFFF